MADSKRRADCPPWLRNMGTAFDDPLESSLEAFKADKAYWDPPSDDEDDRDDRRLRLANTKAAGRENVRRAVAPFVNREDVWGGGLRRMTQGGVGPRREDEHYYAPRYVPIGFARYVSPVVNPGDYIYYRRSGWRIAIPRTVLGPEVRRILQRIYHYGPQSAGFVRLGDTIVPAILSPGDRQTLAGSESRYGPISAKHL